MYASEYVFSRKFFIAWVVVSIIWVWGTMLVAGFFPIIDGWRQILLVVRGTIGRKTKASESDSVDDVVQSKELPDSTMKGLSENDVSG